MTASTVSHTSSPFPTPLTLTTRVVVPSSPPTHLPVIGWGSWPSKGATCTQSVLYAIRAGYRHIDSAQAYGNEAATGAAVRASGIPRSELWLTSKVNSKSYANEEEGVEEVYQGIVESVRKMNGVEEQRESGDQVKLGGKDGLYLDLMLIHGAAMDKGKWNKVQWLGMERAYQEGLVRAIGVSNAGKGLMEEMKEYATVWPPAVNQIEVCTRSLYNRLPLREHLNKANSFFPSSYIHGVNSQVPHPTATASVPSSKHTAPSTATRKPLTTR